MHLEIERKFVPSAAPDSALLGAGVALRQGYLAEEGDTTVRLRVVDGSAIVTIKTGRGLARTEVEVPITASEAEALWPATEGRRVQKVRYRVPLNDGGAADRGPLIAEIDLYGGDLAGLCTIEVEFTSVEAADSFDPPEWFGREVTGDRRWTNNVLAREGRPS